MHVDFSSPQTAILFGFADAGKVAQKRICSQHQASNAAFLSLHLMTAAPHGVTPMHIAAVSM
ncbi:hypothetical protein [Variovorax sp. RCC_210]|uniref:hypothetical protein n=1 Tax=Variovorax sp. RCC_210 TaxID=3239217 RepID=UPI003523DC58